MPDTVSKCSGEVISTSRQPYKGVTTTPFHRSTENKNLANRHSQDTHICLMFTEQMLLKMSSCCIYSSWRVNKWSTSGIEGHFVITEDLPSNPLTHPHSLPGPPQEQETSWHTLRRVSSLRPFSECPNFEGVKTGWMKGGYCTHYHHIMNVSIWKIEQVMFCAVWSWPWVFSSVCK